MSAPKGNRFAAKAKECELALKRAMARKFDGDWRKGLDKIACNVIDLADTGDKWATDMVFDRLDGKPAQTVDMHSQVVVRDARELSDGLLADIATGRSAGVADETISTPSDAELH